VVRGAIYASQNKSEVARMISRDGRGYLPAPAEVVERAMTHYDGAEYSETGALTHGDWGNGRIDFQPWPYPSADALTVSYLRETVVSGDAAFLADLDPAFVSEDLVDRSFVRNAVESFPEWLDDPSVNPGNPFEREEVLAL
jgi:NitT/TauT family transport system substrate-binding protein